MRNFLLITLSVEVSAMVLGRVVQSPRLQTSGEQCCVIWITTSTLYSGIFDRVASRRLNPTRKF